MISFRPRLDGFSHAACDCGQYEFKLATTLVDHFPTFCEIRCPECGERYRMLSGGQLTKLTKRSTRNADNR